MPAAPGRESYDCRGRLKLWKVTTSTGMRLKANHYSSLRASKGELTWRGSLSPLLNRTVLGGH
jgi:hypothetical protein